MTTQKRQIRFFTLAETKERDELKREIAAHHAECEFRTRDPSIWQWAKAYDYVEREFGNEHTDVLRSLVNMGRERLRPRAAQTSRESSLEVSFA